MSTQEPKPTDDNVDTGTFLDVPEGDRLDYDDVEFEDPNEDEGWDMSNVPDGEIVELSTAFLDEEEN